MDTNLKKYIRKQLKTLLESKYGYYKDKDGRIKQGDLADAWADRMDSALEDPKEKKRNTLKNTLKKIKDEETIDEGPLKSLLKRKNQHNNLSITGEYEGEPTTISGEELKNILDQNLEISNSLEDFINKVTYMVTDETSSLSRNDVETLTNYYEQSSLNEEDGSVETDDAAEAEKLAKKGVNVKLTKEEKLRQVIQNILKEEDQKKTNLDKATEKTSLNESDVVTGVGYMASFAIVMIGFILGTAALIEKPGNIKAAIKFIINQFKYDKKSKQIVQDLVSQEPDLVKIKNPFKIQSIRYAKKGWDGLPQEDKDYMLNNTKQGVKDLVKQAESEISLNEDDSFTPNHYDIEYIPQEVELALEELGLTPLDRYIDYVNFMNTVPKSLKIVLTNGNDFDLYFEDFGLVLKADRTIDISDKRNIPAAQKSINDLLTGPIQNDDMEGEAVEDEDEIPADIEDTDTGAEEEPIEEPEA